MTSRMITALVVLGLSTTAAAASDWALDREGEGIQVFTRNDPGYSLKAFKATMRVKAPLDAVVALIADVDAFPEWYASCAENKIIKKLSNKELYCYFVNDSPFPVMDRDSIQHTLITQDPTTRAVKFALKGVPDFIPVRDDRVRVPKMEGHWLATPVSAEETDVLLEMHSDAGGSVPAFLANQQVTVGPHKTFIRMRKMLEKPRYRNAKVDYETAAVTYGK
ncbi:MAG: START domain-containing protein [Myxococcota bacterium]